MQRQQINPPFDGSAPCPMCSQEIRGLSAYAHNRTRIKRDQKWFGKAWCPGCKRDLPFTQFECRVVA